MHRAEMKRASQSLALRNSAQEMVGKVNMDRNSIDALLESVYEAVAANEALIAEWNDSDGLVRPIITPRFIPSCPSAMLRVCGEQAQKYQVPVQSHLSENLGESPWCVSWSPRAASMATPMTAMACSDRHRPSWHTASSVKAKSWN